MAKRRLPAMLKADRGPSQFFDPRAYLRQAVDMLGDVDFDQLDEAGKVAYAQALALVAIAANSRHEQQLPAILSTLKAFTGR